MSRADDKWCRICLSNNEDDNISDASSYAEFLIQLTKNKYCGEIWLCMWCKTILKKTITLKSLALASEKLLQTQNEVITYDSHYYKHLRRLSNSGITHVNVPSDSTDEENNRIIIINEGKNVNDESLTPIQVKHNVVCIKSQCMNDNLNEVNLLNELNVNEVKIEESNHSMDFLNEEIEYQNDNVTLYSKNRNKKSKNNKFTTKQENEIEYLVQSDTKENKLKKQIKLVNSKNSKLDSKLEELKFEVRYLNLEEQMQEMEKKRMKYKDKKFQCDSCGVGFLTNDYLDEHKMRHTKEAGQHECRICSLHFKTPLVLSQHTLSHKRIFSCIICGAQFGKWSNCAVHRQKCGNVVMYVECEICAKVFSDAYSLKVHTRVHSLQKRYSCEQCGAYFSTKQKLAVHVRSHTGQKPFSCPVCARRFSTSSNLRAHGAVHAPRGRHYCVECDSRYNTRKGLQRHLRESLRHVRQRDHMFKCKECSKEFPTEKRLQCHKARHTDSLHEIRCPQCNKTFSNKSNLSKHLKCIHKNVSMAADEK